MLYIERERGNSYVIRWLDTIDRKITAITTTSKASNHLTLNNVEKKNNNKIITIQYKEEYE